MWGKEKERIKDESEIYGHLPKMEMAGKGKTLFTCLEVGRSRDPVRNVLKKQYPGGNQTYESGPQSWTGQD